MVDRDSLDDRQPQTGAPGGPAQRPINTDESLEHALLIVGSDAPA
jgi:hypothetical protein